jgi:hypothetical protein
MSQYFQTPPRPKPSQSSLPVARGPQRSGLALASLILGLVSIPGLLLCIGLPMAVVSLILGILSIIFIRKSPERLSGTGLAVGGLLASCITLGVSAFFLWAAARLPETNGQSTTAPASALRRAESNISVKKGDQIGFGNSQDAEALASEMGEKMKLLRETMFSGSSKSGLSLSGGEFLTHCELHEGTCAFLIHAPGLRKFNNEAKKALSDLAWISAQSVLQESDFPEGGELAVGLKGTILYDDIRTGRHTKDLEGDGELPGLESRGLRTADLDRFFPNPPPPPEAETPPLTSEGGTLPTDQDSEPTPTTDQ